MSNSADESEKAKSRRRSRSYDRDDDSASTDSAEPMDAESSRTRASSSRAHRREKHHSRRSSSRRSRHDHSERRSDRHHERSSERSTSRNFKLNSDAPPFQPTHYTCNQSVQVDDDTFGNDYSVPIPIDSGVTLQTVVSNDYQQSVQAPSYTATMPQPNVVLNDQVASYANGIQSGVAVQQPYMTTSFCSVPPSAPIPSQPQFSAPSWSGPRPYYTPPPAYVNNGFVPYRRPYNPYNNRFNPFGNIRPPGFGYGFGRGGWRFKTYNYQSPQYRPAQYHHAYQHDYNSFNHFDHDRPLPDYKVRHASVPIYAAGRKKTEDTSDAVKQGSTSTPPKQHEKETEPATIPKIPKAVPNTNQEPAAPASADVEEDLEREEVTPPVEVVTVETVATSNSNPIGEESQEKSEEKKIVAANGWILKHDSGAPPTAGWRMEKEGPVTMGTRVVQTGKLRGMRLPKIKLKKTRIDLPFYSANSSLAGSDADAEDENIKKTKKTASRSASAFYPETTLSEAYCTGLFRWLKAMRLHKYTDVLSTLSPEELVACNEEQLASFGLTTGAVKKFMVVRDFLKHPLQSGALHLGEFPCVDNAPKRGIYSNLMNWAMRYGFLSEDDSDQDDPESDDEPPLRTARAQSQENLKMPALTYENRSYSNKNIDVVSRPRFTPRSSSPYSTFRRPFQYHYQPYKPYQPYQPYQPRNPMFHSHTNYRTPFRGVYRASFRGFGYNRGFYQGQSQYFTRPMRTMHRTNPYFVPNPRPYRMDNYMNMNMNSMNNMYPDGSMQTQFANNTNMNMNMNVQYDPSMNNCVAQQQLPQPNMVYSLNQSNANGLSYQAVPVATPSFVNPLNSGITVMQNDQYLNNTVQYAVGSAVNSGNMNYAYVN